jgi:hypothetical protein
MGGERSIELSGAVKSCQLISSGAAIAEGQTAGERISSFY